MKHGSTRWLILKEQLEEGYKVVVVVSAMGRKGDPYATDTLLSLAGGTKTHLSNREQDLLLSCGETISSVVFTEMLKKSGHKRSCYDRGTSRIFDE